MPIVNKVMGVPARDTLVKLADGRQGYVRRIVVHVQTIGGVFEEVAVVPETLRFLHGPAPRMLFVAPK